MEAEKFFVAEVDESLNYFFNPACRKPMLSSQSPRFVFYAPKCLLINGFSFLSVQQNAKKSKEKSNLLYQMLYLCIGLHSDTSLQFSRLSSVCIPFQM